MAGTGTSKLMAIMFTDIVGYSKMMEHDEQLTMQVLEEHNHILFPQIEAYKGRIVDTIGDGLLITFESAYAACNCAMNIQEAVARHNSQSQTSFNLRIGIHMGDIWDKQGKVFGNGVNIAARVLPLSLPGGICITRIVQEQLVNKGNVETESLGNQHLKNITREVEVFRLKTGFEIPESTTFTSGSPGEEKKDKIAEQLEKERNKLREKQQPGNKFESRIYDFVEGVLDRALIKWEEAPEDTKQRAMNQVKREEWFEDGSSGNVSDLIKKEINKEIHKDEDDDDNPLELLGVGVTATVGFGIALGFFKAFWLIFPLIFIGLIPLGIGVAKLLSAMHKKKHPKISFDRSSEKAVIRAAEERKGRLTVMQAAAASDLSMEEAQQLLDDMVRRGYISQEIDSRGLLTYLFPDFLT